MCVGPYLTTFAHDILVPEGMVPVFTLRAGAAAPLAGVVDVGVVHESVVEAAGASHESFVVAAGVAASHESLAAGVADAVLHDSSAAAVVVVAVVDQASAVPDDSLVADGSASQPSLESVTAVLSTLSTGHVLLETAAASCLAPRPLLSPFAARAPLVAPPRPPRDESRSIRRMDKY